MPNRTFAVNALVRAVEQAAVGTSEITGLEQRI